MTVKELRVQLLEVFHYAQLFNADKMIVLDGYIQSCRYKRA